MSPVLHDQQMTASCFPRLTMAGGAELRRRQREQASVQNGPSATLVWSRRGGFGAGEERGWPEPDWSGRGRTVRHRRPPRDPRRRAGLFATAAVLSTAILTASILAAYLYRGRTAPPADPQAAPRHAPASQHLAAAESGLLPWHLPAPLSREVVLPSRHGRLIVLGGLTPGGASAAGVYSVGTRTGAARRISSLGVAVHDAAGAVSGGRALVFGGGSSASIARVQGLTLPGGNGSAASGLAHLPQARSDLAAVTVGATTYLVGGYDGARPDASVLATTDGRTFRNVATLKVPVRYPAVAALGGKIFVFGGLTVTGLRAGTPVNTIQAVDPARHTCSVIGHLPEPLAGAAAATLHGEVFVAGGESTVPRPRAPRHGHHPVPCPRAARGRRNRRGTYLHRLHHLGLPASHRTSAAGRPTPGPGVSRRRHGQRLEGLDCRR